MLRFSQAVSVVVSVFRMEPRILLAILASHIAGRSLCFGSVTASRAHFGSSHFPFLLITSNIRSSLVGGPFTMTVFASRVAGHMVPACSCVPRFSQAVSVSVSVVCHVPRIMLAIFAAFLASHFTASCTASRAIFVGRFMLR